MSNNSALCNKRATLSARCYSLSYRSSTKLQGHALPEDMRARREKVPFWDSAVTDCIRVTRGDCGSGLMRSNRHGQSRAEGAASFPSGTAHPVMPGSQARHSFAPAQFMCHPSHLSPCLQGWWKFSPELEAELANALFCITCSHTTHGEEKVMKAMLPMLGYRLQSSLGEHKLLFPWWFYKVMGKPQLSPSMTNANITSLLP